MKTRAPKDARLLAEFREKARRIVTKDRSLRKLGISVDTAGAIARAMSDAYAIGFAHGSVQRADVEPHPAETDVGFVEWMLIPPRPRSAFWTTCLFTFGHDALAAAREPPPGGHLKSATTTRMTPGWRVAGMRHTPANHVIADRSVQPLLRLGLVAPLPDTSGDLVVTDLGHATWREFLRRGGRYPDHLPEF